MSSIVARITCYLEVRGIRPQASLCPLEVCLPNACRPYPFRLLWIAIPKNAIHRVARLPVLELAPVVPASTAWSMMTAGCRSGASSPFSVEIPPGSDLPLESNLMRICDAHGSSHAICVSFLFPVTIAVSSCAILTLTSTVTVPLVAMLCSLSTPPRP